MTTSKHFSGISASAWLTFAVLQALPVVASAQIEEVVVSTRRREESLQDVPIAVSAITTEQIERQGITDLKDVVQNQPSLQFDQSFGPSDNRITIRGISNTRGRSNVAFLIDGIDVTTENLISAGSGLLANRRLLTDVQRIEIVKGPQSALYGRSAFAGAISYITKEPGDEFDGRVSFDVADYGKQVIDGAFGGPLTDTFGLRITGVKFNEDGYYSNTITGNGVGGSNGYGGALTAVWKPTDVIKVKGRVEYSEEHYDPRAGVNIQGDKVYTLPESGKSISRPIITGDPATQKASSTGTTLYNFGNYCPKFGFDPLNVGPGTGFCLPGIIKSSKGYQVAQSEDPRTGTDFPGTDTESFRASLIATVDLGYGLLSSYTGWTDFNSVDLYDQDYQASTAPDFNGNGSRPYNTSDPRGGRLDTLLGHQDSNQESNTYQFSQEFRYETQWDGPWKMTGGVLFWEDSRQLFDRNNITSCSPYVRIGAQPLIDPKTGQVVKRLLDPNDPSAGTTDVFDPTTGTLIKTAGVCDGTSKSVDSWQQYRRQFSDPQYAAVWDARTKHLSFYGLVEWQMTDDLNLSLEDRFVHEELNLSKPGSSSCTETAFGNPFSPWPKEARSLCDIERLANGQSPGLDPTTGGITLRYIEGSTTSSYNTPKLTLNWKPLDDLTLFFSYAFAEKPGGINQLAGGGGAEPPSIEDERFDPEKLKAWELGVKSGFEAAGFWRLNGSLFFQDYTDKQVGIQVVTESGVSQPRVVNAAGATIWGFEFESQWQPSFMQGLTLALAGTIQDPKYTNWVDDSRNLVKASFYQGTGGCPLVWKYRGEGLNEGSTDPNDPRASDPTASVLCRFDYSGNQLERAPKQAYSASLALQRPFLDTPFEYLFELSGSWQDKRWIDPENSVQLADYALMDMRVGLTSDKWEVIAYVDNLLDDNRFKTGGTGPDFAEQVTDLGFTAGLGTTHYFGTLPDPRVFGIRGAYRFGPAN